MYSLGTWFVSGICVWIPCVKETIIIIIIIIIIIQCREITTIYLKQTMFL